MAFYGDTFETVAAFIASGNTIDSRSAETLSHLADECADRWRQKDSGIWELPVEEHCSTIACRSLRFDGHDRLKSTLDAIDTKLG